jgi:hypothetical protein
MNISQERGKLLSCTSGLGAHFTSPIKARNPKRKTHIQAANTIDPASKRQRLEAELAQLLAHSPQCEQTARWSDPCVDGEECSNKAFDSEYDSVERTGDNLYHDAETYSDFISEPPSSSMLDASANQKSRRLTPDQAAVNLFAKWQATVPTLVSDILSYYNSSVGHQIKPVKDLVQEGCPLRSSCADFKSSKVLCLYFDRKFDFSLLCGKTHKRLDRFQYSYSEPLCMPFYVSSPC